MALGALQAKADELFGKSITHWVLDAGTGMVSGIKAVIAQAEDEVDFSVDEDEDEHADGDEDDDDEGERE